MPLATAVPFPSCAVISAAATIRAAGITLVSIGVGSGINTAWLQKISDYTYDLSGGFSQLNTIVDAIERAACTDVDAAVDCSKTSVTVGSNITLQVVLDNNGAYNITSTIPFTVTLPAGLAFVSVTAPPGAPPGKLARCTTS
jgi:uncharacterized repeat protein (TIGR01451 family)